MTTKIAALLLAFLLTGNAFAQDSLKTTFAIEARITTYIQGGYDIGAFIYPKRSKFSFGVLYAGHDVNGQTRNLLFNSTDHDRLDIRLQWIASYMARYHFADHREGFFAEVGLGAEAFRVRSGDEEITNRNGFISPAIGYIWYPWGRHGFYLLPKVNGVFTLFRDDEQTINGTDFRLKGFFPTPALSLGWKF
ncbi:MAG: hypothetical protein INR69_16110 [Mucilaginibacter polytrichastri]|nr:hypothetical protein [Mucilaginibacter polytrichastri]